MLKDGKVKEKGTHKELMEKDGIYKNLFDKQRELEGYCENNGKAQIIKSVKGEVRT